MSQRFIAREPFQFTNGALGWRPGGPMDSLGPWAKVQNCPIAGTGLRRTCYATNYADTFYSVPAVTRYKGKRINGYFSQSMDGGAVFNPEFRSLIHFPYFMVRVNHPFSLLGTPLKWNVSEFYPARVATNQPDWESKMLIFVSHYKEDFNGEGPSILLGRREVSLTDL
jgi:hypothetical protein